MAMISNKMKKFDELILKELSLIMHDFFPDSFVSVTQVHVSKDLSFAKAWLSCKDNIDQIVKECRMNAGKFRTILAKNVVARKVPKLFFEADKTEDKAIEIDRLIDSTHECD
jgi:ribosome-binding factor A